MLNIVLFGPPGAGKGTQAEKLRTQYELIHLSTGDILRSEIQAGTAPGLKAKSLMDDGKLVPDEVVIGMINTRLENNRSVAGFIFDGFPRTIAQAEALDTLLAGKNSAVTLMLALEVNRDELVKRLLSRGKDSGRPDDADESVISKRIEEYNNKTAPLKAYYDKQGKYVPVQGAGSIGSVFAALCSALDDHTPKQIPKSQIQNPKS